jgi:HAD superfamily hydrolase (TIGR01509 family)
MNSPKFHVNGIILDLDGTIVDSKEAYLDAAMETFAVFGQKLLEQKAAFEIPKRFELGVPLDDLTQGIDVDSFCEVYLKAYYAATAIRSKPFPHVDDALEKLLMKARLALTTRRRVPKSEVVEQLVRFGLSKYFEVIMTGTDAASPKPSPETIAKCSRELGLSTTNCMVVGDSITDIEAGKNAGTRTVAVFSGIFSREELKRANPDLILANVIFLPDFLE